VYWQGFEPSAFRTRVQSLAVSQIIIKAVLRNERQNCHNAAGKDQMLVQSEGMHSVYVSA
jgi:hypothetical protein